MANLGGLLEAIERRARTEADAVIPILQVLAEPDRAVVAPDNAVHHTARRINEQRLAATDRRFRSGALSTGEVRDRLGVSRQAVAERIRVGTLVAAKVGSRWAYPDWQFTATGLAPALPLVLAALTGSTARTGDVMGDVTGDVSGDDGSDARGEVTGKNPDESRHAAAGLDARAADAVMRAPQPDLPDRMALTELWALGEINEVLHRLTVRAEQS